MLGFFVLASNSLLQCCSNVRLCEMCPLVCNREQGGCHLLPGYLCWLTRGQSCYFGLVLHQTWSRLLRNLRCSGDVNWTVTPLFRPHILLTSVCLSLSSREADQASWDTFKRFLSLLVFPCCRVAPQKRWLGWSPTQNRLSTIVCSSTASFWTDCPWTLTHTAASCIQSSPLTLWSQSTPPQKYAVSEAGSLHCRHVGYHSALTTRGTGSGYSIHTLLGTFYVKPITVNKDGWRVSTSSHCTKRVSDHEVEPRYRGPTDTELPKMTETFFGGKNI